MNSLDIVGRGRTVVRDTERRPLSQRLGNVYSERTDRRVDSYRRDSRWSDGDKQRKEERIRQCRAGNHRNHDASECGILKRETDKDDSETDEMQLTDAAALLKKIMMSKRPIKFRDETERDFRYRWSSWSADCCRMGVHRGHREQECWIVNHTPNNDSQSHSPWSATSPPLATPVISPVVLPVPSLPLVSSASDVNISSSHVNTVIVDDEDIFDHEESEIVEVPVFPAVDIDSEDSMDVDQAEETCDKVKHQDLPPNEAPSPLLSAIDLTRAISKIPENPLIVESPLMRAIRCLAQAFQNRAETMLTAKVQPTPAPIQNSSIIPKQAAEETGKTATVNVPLATNAEIRDDLEVVYHTWDGMAIFARHKFR